MTLDIRTKTTYATQESGQRAAKKRYAENCALARLLSFSHACGLPYLSLGLPLIAALIGRKGSGGGGAIAAPYMTPTRQSHAVPTMIQERGKRKVRTSGNDGHAYTSLVSYETAQRPCS